MKDEFDSIINIENYEKYSQDIKDGKFFGIESAPIIEAEKKLLSKDGKSIAYFSMEYGLAPSIYNSFQTNRPIDKSNILASNTVFSNMGYIDSFFEIKVNKLLDIPIYSGGLGVLAGDTLKSSADLGISLVGIGILWNKGYFKQSFWFKYGQVPEEMKWDPYTYPGLIPLNDIIKIDIKDGTLFLKLWKYYVYSYDRKNVVPLILLDANIPQNDGRKRSLTDQLYRSDEVLIKIYQRIILGTGGVKALEELGYSIDTYHLNEGHAAMAFIQCAKNTPADEMDILSSKFAYTCHTPVVAGHDRFLIKDFENVLSKDEISLLKKYGLDKSNPNFVNLTTLALNSSFNVNAVSKKHCEVTKAQFPSYIDKIKAITNGVHTHTWVSKSLAQLFDNYKEIIGDWRRDPEKLKNINLLKNNEQFINDLWQAHQQNKRILVELLEKWRLKEDVFTIAWARRIAGYKRPGLLLYNYENLIELAKRIGPIQVIFAGKAHPNDDIGSTYINEMLDKIDKIGSKEEDYIKIIMLENYDTYYAKILTNSVDVWLNNPLPPFEASGTSGMKAILNGVIQLSTLDGWVVEAEDKNIGKIFGFRAGSDIGSEANLRLKEDSDALYKALEELMSLYYQTNQNGKPSLKSKWLDIMINCIAASSFFNTQRMVLDYQNFIWQKPTKTYQLNTK